MNFLKKWLPVVCFLVVVFQMACTGCGENETEDNDMLIDENESEGGEMGDGEMIVEPEIYLDDNFGLLSKDSPSDNGFFQKSYKVTLETSDGRIGFHAVSSDFVPHLTVFLGTELIFEAEGSPRIDNTTGEPSFWEISTVHTVTRSGNYRVVITSTEPGATGEYTLSAYGAFSKNGP